MRTDFQKQLKFSSTLIYFPNPLRPMLFLTMQALHRLCVHFLPHIGSTQSNTSAGLQKSLCRRESRGDCCLQEHWCHSSDAFHIWKHNRKALPFYTSRQATELWDPRKLRYALVSSLNTLIRGNSVLKNRIKTKGFCLTLV